MAGGEPRDEEERAELSRRRFVQVCVGVATAAAVGSTVASIVGLRPPYDVPAPPPSRESAAVCPVCSVGCGLRSVTSRGEAFPCRGDPQSSHTSGMFCTRGGLLPATEWPSTLVQPMHRLSPATKGTAPSMDQFEQLSWGQALDQVAAKLTEIGSVFDRSHRGAILGGNVPVEDAYVAGKLVRTALSSPAVDSAESMHSRATEAAYLEQLGAIGSPGSYDDVGLADLIVVVGEDLATTHPVLYALVAEAVADRSAKLVLLDPRVTPTVTRTRSTHVPLRAGGEVALLNAIGHVLVHELGTAPSAWARDHALNVEAFAEFLKLYDPEFDANERVDADYVRDLCDGDSGWVAALGNRDAQDYLKSFDVPHITGVEPGTVRDVAKMWNAAGSVVTIWSSRLAGAGDGGAAVSSILNLHLLTGQMGRPGACPLGLQATAGGRGAVDSGATPIALAGAVEPVGQVPGVGAIEMLHRARKGELGALLLVGGSVSAELPDHDNLVAPALDKAFVVATACHLEDPDVAWANMVLPAPSWYERESHFISSERRVYRSLPSLAPLEGPMEPFRAMNGIGGALVAGSLFQASTPTLVMDELRQSTGGAPADLTALPQGDELTEAHGVQWPVPTSRSASLRGTSRRHMGQDHLGPGFPTATGMALISPQEHPGLRRPPSPDYPITAVMSIDADSWWDGQFFPPSGGDVERPRRPTRAYLELAPGDADALGLVEGSLAMVTSAQASLALPVRLADEGTMPGHAFLPWGADARTQALAPSLPLDRNGVPPWSAFPVRVEQE